MIFASEFNDGRVDTSKWLTRTRWSREPSNELQHYAESALQVSGGVLKMTATHRTTGKRDYTSGAICSFGKFAFRYGYVEIRARVPKGQGLWPAFWLGPADMERRSEIDIMEMRGHEPDKNFMVLHFKDFKGQKRMVRKIATATDFSDGFHTWAVDWGPERIVWYIDGIEQFRVDKRDAALYDLSFPEEDMYVIANLAVGGWAEAPKDNDIFPASYLIDYIRVYQQK